MKSTHRYRQCYHCAKNEALPHSNFCVNCLGTSRPLFFPSPRKRNRALTGLLYTGAGIATAYLIVKTVEFVLTAK